MAKSKSGTSCLYRDSGGLSRPPGVSGLVADPQRLEGHGGADGTSGLVAFRSGRAASAAATADLVLALGAR
jgi:hypothetical protein